MFLTIFITVVPVFGIILLGFASQRMRFMPAEMASCLNQFVYWIALPTLLFHELASMNTGELPGALLTSLVGCAVLAPVAAFYLLLLWPNRQPGRSAGMGAVYATFPNGAFVGLPMLALLWPDNSFALLSGSLSAVAYTVVLVVGDVGLQATSGSRKDGLRHFLAETSKTLWRNPLLMATLAGIIWSFLGLPLSGPLRTVTTMLRGTAAPCALFCMGMLLAGQMDLIRQRGNKSAKRSIWPQVSVHVFKLILHPLLTWAIMAPLGVAGVALGTSIMQAAMPTGLASYVVAEKHRINAEDAPLILMTSTALSIVTVPTVAMVLRIYGLV